MLLNRFDIFIFFCLFCLAQKFNKIEREREENVSSREKQTMRSENLNFDQAKYISCLHKNLKRCLITKKKNNVCLVTDLWAVENSFPIIMLFCNFFFGMK